MDDGFGMGKKVIFFREVPGGNELLTELDKIDPLREVIPRGAALPYDKASLFLTEEMAQGLFEALQEYGLKPKGQSFVEGKLEATEAHLKDVRTLLKLK